ncbi:uncharacterized protein EV422DRAFT_383551 [Fimicolochytrium jonesii]|uniref:uncharacterized protein n=1 Tax=Fimicolochytrium jonesii TaxID=1396493 RepID=UPI0022FDF853|nr:uncharacterized protein EV422DRAFT_383551 [Fimicolochytrium jonesii]KAI8822900.1 hypothetical protein EV422DRAFT_383551 [Fimicolochytrium jonesii]
MPPKKKEKKKSKKDIEKEKLLEEERLRAEEEARQAEQARKEQELLERQQREALEAIFVQDAARFDSEAAELATLTATRASRLEAILKSRREEAEWQAYLQCRPLPNPLNERNLVTYLDEWAVDSERDENSFSLEKLYTELPGIDILCGEIEQHLHAPADGRNARSEALGRDLIRIRELINGKWNMATMRTLQHIDQFPREANENFQFLSTTKDYVYGIWGNLTKNPRHKVIEFPSVHISASLPKPLVLANIAIRLLLESGITATATYEKQEGPTPMSVIGPVLQLDLIEMPDMPKVVDAWTIRPMVSKDGKIKRITYPFKKEATEEDEDLAEKPDTAPAGDDSQSGADGPGPAVSDSSLWPTTVTFQLEPGCLLHNGVATVRWWNSKMEWWDEDGIADVEIDPASGLVRFKTIHFAPTAVVQYTYAEFPYEDWSIRPIAPNSAILHIRGLLNDLEIEVGPGKCRALRPALDLSQLAEGEAWLFPAILFRVCV